MSRYWSGLVGAVMVLFMAELPLPAQTKAPIEIGAFLPLTGKFALPGDQQKKGILAATQDINAAGGINGRPVKLVIEDTSDSNTTAITAVQKLVEKPYPALLGTVLGTQMLAAMPIIKQSQVPTVTTSGTRKVTQQGNPWIFRVTPHDGISKPALVKFGADALHIKKAAILYGTDEYGQSGRDIYLQAMKLHGIKPVAIVSVDEGEQDLSSQLLRIKNSGADGIFSQLHDNAYALVIRQAKRLGITIPHIAAASAGNETMKKLLTAGELNGIYFEGFYSPYDKRPVVREWVARYKKQTGALPDTYVALGYDQALVVYKAMAKYGVTRAGIQKGLRAISVDGMSGTLQSDVEQSMGHRTLIFRWGPNKIYKLMDSVEVPFKPYREQVTQ